MSPRPANLSQLLVEARRCIDEALLAGVEAAESSR
jgi:hypothetical protein